MVPMAVMDNDCCRPKGEVDGEGRKEEETENKEETGRRTNGGDERPDEGGDDDPATLCRVR